MKILFFFAHPDDETLACGGTIASAVENGNECVVATPVVRCGYRGDLVKAMKVLGVECIAEEGLFDDNQLDKYPRTQLNEWLEKIISTFKPGAVFTHFYNCTNVDHRRCYEASIVATRPMGQRINLLMGEVPSSTGYMAGDAFKPNYYVPLEQRHIDKKIAAMESYSTEKREQPHPRSPDSIIALARLRGSECSSEFAEAFQIVRMFG